MSCSPWEAKCRTSASEFWRWQAFFEWEHNERTPEMWYMAQIASCLESIAFRVWGKAPPAAITTVSNYLLKFKVGDEQDAIIKTEEELRHEAAAKSKSGWMPMLDPNGDRSAESPKGLSPEQKAQLDQMKKLIAGFQPPTPSGPPVSQKAIQDPRKVMEETARNQRQDSQGQDSPCPEPVPLKPQVKEVPKRSKTDRNRVWYD